MRLNILTDKLFCVKGSSKFTHISLIFDGLAEMHRVYLHLTTCNMIAIVNSEFVSYSLILLNEQWLQGKLLATLILLNEK